MTITLIITCLLLFVLSLFRRDKIWKKASLSENIITAVAVLGSISFLIFSNPITAGAAVMYSLGMVGMLSGSFASMVVTLIRFLSKDYKDNIKFKGTSIATWVLGVINIILIILIGAL